MTATRKNILITGASSGLGFEMANQFASMGRNLALCARRLDKLEALKQQLEQKYPHIKVSICTLDVNDHEAVFNVFRQFKQEFGQLDRIIVNAGINAGAQIGTGQFQANKQTAVTNFVSALAQCEAALDIFREQNHGHLVTMSSISALRGFQRKLTVYAASKAALTSLSEGIRVDLKATPINVTTVHPGYINSELTQDMKNTPMMASTSSGVRSIVQAIERESHNAYVPFWPWAVLRYLLPLAPLSVLRRFS